MGAKAWFAAYYDQSPRSTLSSNPELDRAASVALAKRLFPRHFLQKKEEGVLTFLNPGDSEIFVGVYGDLKIVAHLDLSIATPSQIAERWHIQQPGSTLYLHATHSAVDWCSFALWKEGRLQRSVSVSPDGGVQEDIGDPLPFEEPYWNGSCPVEDDAEEDDRYPLPFHPLELSEEAMLAMLGFQFEGFPDQWVCDPMEVPIMRFEISRKPWWQVW